MTISLQMELEKRLENWAYWVVWIEKGEAGYPEKSILAEFGMVRSGISQSKPPFPLKNIEAQRIHTWINRMGVEYSEYKKVIGRYYLRAKGKRIWELAQEMKISPDSFKRLLNSARYWLEGRLSYEYPSEIKLPVPPCAVRTEMI